MAKYLLVFTDGSATSGQEMMQPTPEQQQAMIAAWTAWYTALGDHVADPGNPTGASSTVSASGRSEGGASKVTGYTVLSADSLDQAAELTKGCPILADGGNIEIYETFNVM